MRIIDILNQLAIKSDVFSFDEFVAAHGGSTTAAANAARRLTQMGLVDRVARGAYAIRPIGRIGTRAASEDLALPVGARFGGTSHRIGFRTALDFHGLLTRPSRTIQVATDRPTAITELGGRPFQSVSESASTIHIGSMNAGHGARISDPERTLLDAARRVDLVGGVSVIADALSRLSKEDYDPHRLVRYADMLQLAGPLRRLASIAKNSDRIELVDVVAPSLRHRHRIPVDPRARSGVAWVDPDFKVAWAQEQLDELGIRRVAA